MTRILIALSTGTIVGVGIVALAGYLVLFHGPDLDQLLVDI